MPYSPSVSVIVPVYKQEKYLGQCLESVANQTFQDWECIVVDDGSDKPDLIDNIASSSVGDRGSVVHQNNRGLAAARNIGIADASGRFLVCLDADDYLHLEFLEKTTAVLNNNNEPGVVYCWTRHFGARQDMFIPPSNIHLFWLLQRNLIPVTCLFSKEIWENIGGFDKNMHIGHEDWDFWIRVCLAGYKFSCIGEPLFYYRQSPYSMIPKMAKYRVNTIHYIRHKHPQLYFIPLKKLFTCPAFQGVPWLAVIRFWLSGLFFHYMPQKIMRRIFQLYQKFAD
jgi:glycosyltransferase involved in cell wall biosynthesis